MDQLADRTKYLKKVESTLASFNSKFEDLVKSLGWTVESLTRKTKEFDDSAFDKQPETPLKKEETEKGNAAEAQDYEKIYNDLVANMPNQINKSSDKSQTQILVEMLELERNTKRRRISYKNKVHTRNKSQTEVLRALVQEQMDVLKEMSGLPKEDDAKKGNHRSEDSKGLIEVHIRGGNPHAAWKRIERLVEDAQASGDSERKRKSSSASRSPERKRKRQHDDTRYGRGEGDWRKRRDDQRRGRIDDVHNRYIDSWSRQHDDRLKHGDRRDRRDLDRSSRKYRDDGRRSVRQDDFRDRHDDLAGQTVLRDRGSNGRHPAADASCENGREGLVENRLGGSESEASRKKSYRRDDGEKKSSRSFAESEESSDDSGKSSGRKSSKSRRKKKKKEKRKKKRRRSRSRS